MQAPYYTVKDSQASGQANDSDMSLRILVLFAPKKTSKTMRLKRLQNYLRPVSFFYRLLIYLLFFLS